MSGNPYKASHTTADEYLKHDKSPPAHLRAVTGVLIVHAVIALLSMAFSSFLLSKAASIAGASIVSEIMRLASIGFLFMTAYLLYRRSKWAFLPALLYMLYKWIIVYSSYTLYQSYFASHPGEAASFTPWEGAIFWLSTLPNFVLPALMGTFYTGYCLYQRKRRVLT